MVYVLSSVKKWWNSGATGGLEFDKSEIHSLNLDDTGTLLSTPYLILGQLHSLSSTCLLTISMSIFFIPGTVLNALHALSF